MKFNFRDGKKDIVIGQKVYVQNVNKWSGEHKVKKLGRSLVHLDNSTSFYAETGHERSDYGHNTLWSSKAAFEEDKKKEELISSIRPHFDFIGMRNKTKSLTVGQLKGILEMLEGIEDE